MGESFQRRGIGVFPSADQSDPRTLHRLKRILSTFEGVTTNGYGSHIAYAAYCGARVSIFGPFAEFPRHRMVRTHAVKMFPKLVDIGYYLCTEKALREHYPFLFVEPHEAPEESRIGDAVKLANPIAYPRRNSRPRWDKIRIRPVQPARPRPSVKSRWQNRRACSPRTPSLRLRPVPVADTLPWRNRASGAPADDALKFRG